MVAVEQDRLLLLAKDVRGLVDDGSWEAQAARDAGMFERLSSFGVEATIAPYGATAHLDASGSPVYEDLFYLLPSWIDSDDELAFASDVRLVPSGRFAKIGYAGAYSEVSRAYRALSSFLEEGGLEAEGPIYEVSQTRLLDTDDAHCRCVLSVRVSDRVFPMVHVRRTVSTYLLGAGATGACVGLRFSALWCIRAVKSPWPASQ